ncbi:hypothetical protein B5C34_12760 [Pacificimonas flava]|uniref:Phytanoyl-CoA dioxygenase n=2 Tax=Pacificimonas TaxID=1960290 RepID=A0A219B773_9SPHN|nr:MULTISPECIES: phytanoyl-CoA dioxygenase family protein [Pacificimonas]MBZ6378463.1 phytanoyl-CoA dioxygenase family protein [Pacificimonas aurantium]OWV34242.1 hypothetical protein B5C34_12760 [Pacificimonas flava]
MIERAISEIWDDYDREGYAVVRGFLNAAEVETLSRSIDEVAEDAAAKGANWRHGNLNYRLGADHDGTLRPRMAQWMAYRFSYFDKLRSHPDMGALLVPRLGGDIKQIINQIHWKPPQAASSDFAFHQDSRFRKPFEAYRNLGSSYVQTGIAIDPHGAASGGMKLAPRTHLKGPLALDTSNEVMSSEMASAELAGLGIDPEELIDLELAPGDLALWSPYTVHGSGTNRSEHQRRFLINGYVRANDCDRGEYAFRGGEPAPLKGEPALVHYDALRARPEPHFTDVQAPPA